MYSTPCSDVPGGSGIVLGILVCYPRVASRESKNGPCGVAMTHLLSTRLLERLFLLTRRTLHLSLPSLLDLSGLAVDPLCHLSILYLCR